MTNPTDQFIDIAKRSQGAVTTAVRSWADTAQTFIGDLTDVPTKLPDTQAYVDTYFDFVAKVLTNQREIAHRWVTTAQRAIEAVTEEASHSTESLTANGGNTAEAVAEPPAATGRVGGRQVAASTARTIARP